MRVKIQPKKRQSGGKIDELFQVHWTRIQSKREETGTLTSQKYSFDSKSW